MVAKLDAARNAPDSFFGTMAMAQLAGVSMEDVQAARTSYGPGSQHELRPSAADTGEPGMTERLWNWYGEQASNVVAGIQSPLQGDIGVLKGAVRFVVDTADFLSSNFGVGASERLALQITDAATGSHYADLVGAQRQQQLDMLRPEYSNAAQAGGGFVFDALSMATGVAGLAKAGMVGLARLGRVVEVGPLIGRSSYGSIEEFTDAVTSKYQSLYDQGYERALQNAQQELIADTSRAIGSDADAFARVQLRDWLKNVEGIEEGPGKIIEVNRRLYDPAGSGAYRVPDVYIPGSRTILDGSISFKTGSSAQIVDFGRYSGGARTTIITPSGLPWGSYGIVQ